MKSFVQLSFALALFTLSSSNVTFADTLPKSCMILGSEIKEATQFLNKVKQQSPQNAAPLNEMIKRLNDSWQGIQRSAETISSGQASAACEEILPTVIQINNKFRDAD